MRISVFPDDPGYPVQGAYDVYLDGKLLTNCYTADDKLVEVVVFDSEATVEKFGDVPTKTLRGDVRIVPKIDGWYFD